MPNKPKPKKKVPMAMPMPASKRARVRAERMGVEGPKGKPKKTISYPPPSKPKSAPRRETAAKKVVKASEGSAANLARSGEMQRREMARTRLVQQQGRMTAAERRKVTERNKDIKLKKIQRATARINRRSAY
jgi:hypothetical protein